MQLSVSDGRRTVTVTGPVADIITYLLSHRSSIEERSSRSKRLTFHIKSGSETQAELTTFEPVLAADTG
jgi:hypothetical protein